MEIIFRRLRLLLRLTRSLLLIFENNGNEHFFRFSWFIKNSLFHLRVSRLICARVSDRRGPSLRTCSFAHTLTHFWAIHTHARLPHPETYPRYSTLGRPAMRNARCAIHYGFLEGAFHPPGGSFKGCTPCVYACWKDDPCCPTWARVGGRAGLSHPRGGDFAGWVNRL